jgi:hypothetical protein
MEQKTMEWPKLCPMVGWIMNSQISTNTGYSPSELFLGKPSWQFQTIPEPATNPLVKNGLEEQMVLQEIAIKRLEKLRERGETKEDQRAHTTKMILCLSTKTDGPKEKFQNWNPHGLGLSK